jgi:hypothetical protein
MLGALQRPASSLEERRLMQIEDDGDQRRELMVAKDGIEPPTQGFSDVVKAHLSTLIYYPEMRINKRLTKMGRSTQLP